MSSERVYLARCAECGEWDAQYRRAIRQTRCANGHYWRRWLVADRRRRAAA